MLVLPQVFRCSKTDWTADFASFLNIVFQNAFFEPFFKN
nr:MAG TPA: hypothetical protein [Siphoviridae sp. ctX8T1]